MNIAIIGTGIAGNVLAYHLQRRHRLTVYEAASHVGGHSNTIDVEVDGRHFALDTGFIVFNDWTYPNFVRLLNELGVESQPSRMSFSVRCERTGLEYNGTSLNSLFAQRRNLLRPAFYRMLADILRFNREAPALLEQPPSDLTLGEYLARGRYSRQFIEHYILPMGSAIWSASQADTARMPVQFFARFFANHGMLSIDDRPQWRVIKGGSRRYVRKLAAGFRDRILLDTPVEAVRRHADHVELKARGHAPRRYDRVFFACHSDQALRVLADASALERRVLGAIRYQPNEAVLHTDSRLLPRARRAWAAWNYHIGGGDRSSVTYNMNILQSLRAPRTFCVTLNPQRRIDPAQVIARFEYSHPLFDAAALAAQQQHVEINGAARTYFCGAYWRNGFHEDGVVSALATLEHFERRERDEELHLRRAS